MLNKKKDESYIPTGIQELDDLLGGGLPRGRIVEMWGVEGSGKTHVAVMIAAHLSKDQKILYVDSEFALNRAHVEALGADPSKIAYIADSRLENVCESIVKAVGTYDVIVLDSLAQLTPLAVANAEVGERSIGLFALLIKHWILKLRPLLANSDTAFLVLNQFRPPIGMYVTEQPPGGTVFRHSCDIRIKLSKKKSGRIIEGKKQIGHEVELEVKKNRMGPTGLTTKFNIYY